MAYPKSELLRRVILAVDWYLNIQVVNKKPWWDNNHGRFIYTRHMPTGKTVLGICWTQARGIMCCLAAYQRTRKAKYLEAAERAAAYLLQLQIMDPSDPRFYGALHEEIYCSEDSNVRDAAESALALTCLYRITRNREYLRRAELWMAWHLKHGVDAQGFPLAHYNLVNAHKTPSGFSFSGANAMALYALYQVTRREAYKKAFKRMVGELIRRFWKDGPAYFIAGTFASHHASKGAEQGVALNDDGDGVVLLQAFKLLKDCRYLDMALRYGDYLLKQKLPYGIYSAHPGRFNFLADLAHVSGQKKYSGYVEANLGHLLKLQHLKKGDRMHHGAFRGEDEPGRWYGPRNAKPLEFVNNRMTAYSVYTLFKLEGKVTGRYYSALD